MGSFQVERTDAHGDHEPEMRKRLEINERMFRFMERISEARLRALNPGTGEGWDYDYD